MFLLQHNHIGYTSLTEGPKLVAKVEEKRDFAVSLNLVPNRIKFLSPIGKYSAQVFN